MHFPLGPEEITKIFLIPTWYPMRGDVERRNSWTKATAKEWDEEFLSADEHPDLSADEEVA